MHLFGLIIRIYHDELSTERQIVKKCFFGHPCLCCSKMTIGILCTLVAARRAERYMPSYIENRTAVSQIVGRKHLLHDIYIN